MSNNQLYDPPYPPNNGAGGGAAGGGAGQTKTSQIQDEINRTINLMSENIRVTETRGGKLDDLQNKTDDLAISAQGFRRGANRVRKQMWWKDMKMRMCLVVGIIVLLAVIIVPIVVTKR